MSPERKMMARVLFQLKIHKSNGAAFERLFADVMQYARPDLDKIKPYGNQGDRGNDAYQKNDGRYFQMYAPEEPANTKQEAIVKAKTDFETKLLPHWSGFCPVKEYYFVFNDKYHGTSFPIEKELAQIKETHSLNAAEVYLAKHLEQEFISLEEDQILTILGTGSLPRYESTEGLDYSVIAEVIQYIQNTPIDHIKNGKLVVPDINEKILFNDLNAFSEYLKIKQRETWQIDDYFSRNSDFAKSVLRDHLSSYYQESILEIPDGIDTQGSMLGDLRFAYVLDRIAPITKNAAHDRARRDVALVIMARYFETCDIFEEPTNAHA